MKVIVNHWMGTQPPHPDAVWKEDRWIMTLYSLGDLEGLSEEYDVMFLKSKKTGDFGLFLDAKGKRFRQRQYVKSAKHDKAFGVGAEGAL